MLAWIMTIACLGLLFLALDKWILTPMMQNEKKVTVAVRYEDYVIGPDGIIHYNYKKLDKHY